MSSYRQQKTPMTTTEEAKASKKWFIIDASGQVVGRLASQIANILRGKHRPEYTPHTDLGDGVIVINAEKVVMTGNKEEQKIYRHHTLWQGGLKEIPYKEMMEKHPERILERAVRGMLARGGQGKRQFKRLRCIAGAEHDMQAQQPIELTF